MAEKRTARGRRNVEMSPKQALRSLADGDFLRQVTLYLLGAVLTLVSYEYFRVVGEIERRLSAVEARADQADAAFSARAERVRAVEEAVAHIRQDVASLRDDIRSLNEKIDQLIQRVFSERRTAVL